MNLLRNMLMEWASGAKHLDDGDGTFDRSYRFVYDTSGKPDPATGVPLDDVVLVFQDPDGSGSQPSALSPPPSALGSSTARPSIKSSPANRPRAKSSGRWPTTKAPCATG